MKIVERKDGRRGRFGGSEERISQGQGGFAVDDISCRESIKSQGPFRMGPLSCSSTSA